jgi:hypothetical protein
MCYYLSTLYAYSETLEFNAHSEFDSFQLISTRFTSLRFDSKSTAKQNQIFMIRIELAICPNKALDSIDSMQKRPSTRIRFGRTES